MIPVLNLYYLLSYAWEFHRAAPTAPLTAADCPDVENLLAHLLDSALRAIRQRGWERRYLPETEALARPRGRMRLIESERRFLPDQGQLLCDFDELSANTPAHRILRGTLDRLATCPSLTHELRVPIHRWREVLRDVPPIRFVEADCRRLTFPRHQRAYRFALAVCALARRSLLPGEGRGARPLPQILDEEMRMHGLFEKFVLHFAHRHAGARSVGSPTLTWDAIPLTPRAAELLPEMRTDVTIEWPDATVVVDCKYYRDTLSEHRERRRFHTAHLYQMHAYLTNWRAQHPAAAPPSGLLLYPETGDALHETLRLLGLRLSVATLDLSREWPDIHASLFATLTACRADLPPLPPTGVLVARS